MPTNTTAPDFYGGHRPGDNLFAESLICARPRDRQASLAFPDGAPRAVGLRQSGRAKPARPHDRRPPGQGDRADQQAGLRLHVRSRDQGSRSGRSTSGRCRRQTSRASVPRRRSRFRPGPPPFEQQGVTVDDLADFTPEIRAMARRGRQAVPARPALHAAVAAGHNRASVDGRRRQLVGRGRRSRDGDAVRAVAQRLRRVASGAARSRR